MEKKLIIRVKEVRKSIQNLFVFLLLSAAGGLVSATPIEGFATDNGSITPVGATIDGDIIYYIPLISGPDLTYGVDGGTSSDSITLNGDPIDGALLNMYLYFDIPDGEVGTSLTLQFKDLDLLPYNDPDGFFEALTLIEQGGLHNYRFTDFGEIDLLASASVTNNDVGTNNDITITFNDLNIASGDFWLNLGFDAYSTFKYGDWTNTKEKVLGATITTSKVPEPTSIVLLGLGLLGLFAVRCRQHKIKINI